jgi:CDP-glucose 4,6-dehydratase
MKLENFYRGKKVLVTGHTGFKGSWLCAWLVKMGAKVCGYSLNIPTVPSHFDSLALSSEMKHVLGDVRDKKKLEEIIEEFQPDLVFHLAAMAIVRTCYDSPIEAFETNMGGTMNLLDCLRHSSSVKAAIFITSDKCYENVEWTYGYRETDALGGKDPYSASKACAENVFHAYFHSYFSSGEIYMATTRAGNVIGGADWAKDRIVPDCIRAWANQQTLKIRHPHATRPWQHVLEPLSGYLWLGQCLFERRVGINGESFNFGPKSEVEQTVEKLVKQMQNDWDGKYEIHFNEEQKKEAGLLKLCCDKIQAKTGWKAILDFSETVSFTTRWYKEFYKNKGSIKNLTYQDIEYYQELAITRKMPWI